MKATNRPMDPIQTTDHYSVLGVDFSLTTDSAPVRDFFKAAYRRFVRNEAVAGALALTATLGPGATGPFAQADEARLDLGGRSMPENRAFLFLLNALMDRVSDFLVVHGAAFSIDGRGFILAGSPTAGKSTLALELGRRGAVLFSDDVAPLHRSTGMLHPFPRAIGVRRGGAASSWFDPDRIPEGMVHALPHKWLVDAEALGLQTATPRTPPVRVEAVFHLTTEGGPTTDPLTGTGDRHLEIALAESDDKVLGELATTPGVSRLAAVHASLFPLYTFTASRSAHAMLAIADLCRRHRDIVLYLDEQRPLYPARPAEPIISEAKWSALLIELARELQNRSESGLLMRSCGNLAGLVSELSGALSGARAWRLQAGEPGRTAERIFELTGRRSAA